MNLIKRLAAELGLPSPDRLCIPKVAPEGSGDAWAWVLSQVVPEVRALRARSMFASTALVVMYDADVETCARASRRFAQALSEAKLMPRSDGEPIVLV